MIRLILLTDKFLQGGHNFQLNIDLSYLDMEITSQIRNQIYYLIKEDFVIFRFLFKESLLFSSIIYIIRNLDLEIAIVLILI